MKYALLTTAFLVAGCGKQSGIEGRVEDVLNRSPLANVMVIASMTTNIKEDMKYQTRSAATDASGKFTIRGLSEKYSYNLMVGEEEFVSDVTSVQLQKARTTVMNTAIRACRRPAGKGIHFWIDGKWFTPEKLSSRFHVAEDRRPSGYHVSEASIFIPECADTKRLTLDAWQERPGQGFPVTEAVRGEMTGFDLDPDFVVSVPVTISVVGDGYDYTIFPLTRLPGVSFLDPRGFYEGVSDIPCGIHLGVRSACGIAYTNRQVTLFRDLMSEDIYRTCKESLGPVRIGSVCTFGPGYYALVPNTPLAKYFRSDYYSPPVFQKALEAGIEGIVFKAQ